MKTSNKLPVKRPLKLVALDAKSTKRPAVRAAAKVVANPASKQERILALLRPASGTTIAEMMAATGWQGHSVRGFLSGVVRKRLKLKLESTKVGDDRSYRIVGASSDADKARQRAA